jgi:hypothetical protein
METIVSTTRPPGYPGAPGQPHTLATSLLASQAQVPSIQVHAAPTLKSPSPKQVGTHSKHLGKDPVRLGLPCAIHGNWMGLVVLTRPSILTPARCWQQHHDVSGRLWCLHHRANPIKVQMSSECFESCICWRIALLQRMLAAADTWNSLGLPRTSGIASHDQCSVLKLSQGGNAIPARSMNPQRGTQSSETAISHV